MVIDLNVYSLGQYHCDIVDSVYDFFVSCTGIPANTFLLGGSYTMQSIGDTENVVAFAAANDCSERDLTGGGYEFNASATSFLQHHLPKLLDNQILHPGNVRVFTNWANVGVVVVCDNFLHPNVLRYVACASPYVYAEVVAKTEPDDGAPNTIIDNLIKISPCLRAFARSRRARLELPVRV